VEANVAEEQGPLKVGEGLPFPIAEPALDLKHEFPVVSAEAGEDNPFASARVAWSGAGMTCKPAHLRRRRYVARLDE
jgi:hypothetical protein